MRLTDYANQYILDKLETLSIERSTADDYRKAVRAWVRAIGDAELPEISEEHVKSGMKTMLSCGTSPRTVSKRYTVLKMLLTDALKRGHIQADPFALLRKPRFEDLERNYLERDERERLKARLSSMKPSPYVLADMLALYAGLRAEEVSGLQVRDVDLAVGMGHVRRAIGRDGHQTYEKPTKSRHRRDFPLSSDLRAYLAVWLDVPAALQPDKTAYLLTFTQSWLHPAKIGRMWSKMCDVDGFTGSTGRKPTFHDLRHTFATACVAEGMDIKTLQAILGHKDAAMTLNVYASADKQAKLAASAIIDRAI